MSALQNAWAGGRRPLWLRLCGPPLERLFAVGVELRNRRFDRGAGRRVSIPVLSVGNISVGGTGKTPFAAWLVRSLLEDDHRPALLMRGYGDDEVQLHAEWNPRAPVIVNGDRIAGAERAAAEGADVVVMDDGFQHRRLGRDLDIVLVAAEQSHDIRLLPMGRYREPLEALDRADAVILSRRTATDEEVAGWRRRIRECAPAALYGEVRFVSTGFRNLRGIRVPVPDREVLAVSAIADPDPFLRMVRSETRCDVEPMMFGDHHRYDAADVERIVRAAGPRPVVVTEKDAVKLRGLAGTPEATVVLHLGLRWENGETSFRERVADVVRDDTP